MISVVLGTYNRLIFLKETIKSIRKEISNFDLNEIIVVDGGSTDGTIEWLTKQKDILTIIQHNRGKWNGKPLERKSWGYFMNLAFKCAKGEYICMVSDDCLVVPNTIVNGIEEFKNSTKIGGVAFYFRDYPKEQQYKIHRSFAKRIVINHGLFLRKALEKVNWIDEDTFHFYSADGDLCLRIWEAGYEIVDSKQSFIEHCHIAPERLSHSSKEHGQKDFEKSKEKWKDLIEKNDNFISDWPKINYVDPNHTSDIFDKLLIKQNLNISNAVLKNVIKTKFKKILQRFF